MNLTPLEQELLTAIKVCLSAVNGSRSELTPLQRVDLIRMTTLAAIAKAERSRT